MPKKSITSDVILLPNVRLSFSRLFVPKAFQAGQEPRYEATFLFDPSKKEHKETIKKLLKTASDIAKQAYGLEQSPYAVRKLAHELLGGEAPKGKNTDGIILAALYDGNTKTYDGYENMVALATHNKVRPTVVNRKSQAVNEGEEGAPYSGCYVNGKVTIWAQNNDYGKRLNFNLRSVQYVQKGTAFGIQSVDAEGEFDALEDEEFADSESSSDGFED